MNALQSSRLSRFSVFLLSALLCISILKTDRRLLSLRYFPAKLHGVLKFLNQPQQRHAPSCENLLKNLTSGTWFHTSHDDDAYFNDVLRDYWKKRGIQEKQWRDDGRCGYYRTLPKVTNGTWKQTASWCDPTGEKPCCSNKWNGRCSRPEISTCECSECVNLRNYKHAETSQWITSDSRCSWVNHTGATACDVIEQSPFNDIYFVGDSFIRNMFVTLLMLLSDDPIRGTWAKNMSKELEDDCVSGQVYFWKKCRKMIASLNEVINRRALCGGREPQFNVTLKPYYSAKFRDDFRALVRRLTGVKGSLIFLSTGFHMQCRSSATIKSFFEPALSDIEQYYSNKSAAARWPQIYFALPMPLGLLKPPEFLSLQNDSKIETFAKEMRNFCDKSQVHVFDFRPLGKFVHSFDGTHYGKAVNLMKNQVFLNYIASLKPLDL